MSKAIHTSDITWESLNLVQFTPLEYLNIPREAMISMETQGYFVHEETMVFGEERREHYYYVWSGREEPSEYQFTGAYDKRDITKINEYRVRSGNIVYTVFERIYNKELA